MAKKKAELVLDGRDKEYYDTLVRIREAMNNQMQNRAEEVLDSSNADKRGVTTHMADVSSDNSRQEMELRMIAEEGNELKLISDALQRLSDGDFGHCQECGQMIPEGRLKIRPYARYCVKCKSRMEQSR